MSDPTAAEVQTLAPAARGRAKPVCRHCRRCPVNRPRGLCWGCWHRPAVRALYPPGSGNPATAKFARRSAPDFTRASAIPVPTTARPGTPEKVAVMAARADRGELVFHPHDAGHE